MSTDRPGRLTDRITELWNDRPRADRTKELLSLDRLSSERISSDRSFSDRPFADSSPADGSSNQPIADRSADRGPAEFGFDRPSARFSDPEPLTPVSGPSASASSAPSPSPGPTPAPNRIRSWAPQPKEPTPRAVGSPLPTGSALSAAPSSSSSATPASRPAPSPAGSSAQPGKNLALGRGRVAAQSAPLDLPSAADLPSGVQRIVNAVRASLPFIQRILPLLDGNVGTAVSNLMAPPPHRPAPPPPPVNLAPLEESISSLQAQHHDLRSQIADQNTSLKRVEDQLEMVREATDRNTLEQQELLEDLKGVGNKVNIFAMVALLLLVVSVMVNVILYLHIKRVLP